MPISTSLHCAYIIVTLVGEALSISPSSFKILTFTDKKKQLLQNRKEKEYMLLKK